MTWSKGKYISWYLYVTRKWLLSILSYTTNNLGRYESFDTLRPKSNGRHFANDFFKLIFVPPPLGAGGIMFSSCPSVRPSETWNTLFPPVHESVGPSDQPWPFCGMSVRPSGEVYGNLPENAWREWPDILHADVSWPPWELIRLWWRFVDFCNFGTILI